MGVFQPVSTTPKGGITSIDFQSDFPSSWKSGLEDLPIAAYNRWLELKTHFQHDYDYSVRSTEYLDRGFRIFDLDSVTRKTMQDKRSSRSHCMME